MGTLETAACFIGIIPKQHFQEATNKLTEFQAAVQTVGGSITAQPCLVFCMKDVAQDVQKALRSSDFEPVSFEGLKGTVADNITQRQGRVAEIERELANAFQTATEIATERLKLVILADHYHNFLIRKQTQSTAPATHSTIFLEGWVKKEDYPHLVKLLEAFDGADIAPVEPGTDEVIPVELFNNPVAKPFETVTNLYGMPAPSDLDPTAFLAPFFALFFGICMADAAYGVVMVALFWWLQRKLKGDNRFAWMMVFCSITTIVAGALTGSWCGDAITQFVPALEGFRNALMWFDPLIDPMKFFMISLGLGYAQIIFGIFLAFIHKYRRGMVKEALLDHGIWLLWLNSLLLFGLSKAGYLPGFVASICLITAIVPGIGSCCSANVKAAGAIASAWAVITYSAQYSMSATSLAISTDGSGHGRSRLRYGINEIVRQVGSVPYVGWFIGLVIFVGGHAFNIANSMLGSFVHSMRLQFVEFFTKFLVGGGVEFKPLRKEYKYIEIDKNQK